MELGDHVRGDPIPQAADRTRAIFHHLCRLPPLRDIMVPVSALAAHKRVLVARQMSLAVAHVGARATEYWPERARENDGGIPNPRAANQAQAVFRRTGQLPALRDGMVSQSALVEQRVLTKRQVSFAVAHA